MTSSHAILASKHSVTLALWAIDTSDYYPTSDRSVTTESCEHPLPVSGSDRAGDNPISGYAQRRQDLRNKKGG
jgi:hypothetical protein